MFVIRHYAIFSDIACSTMLNILHCSFSVYCVKPHDLRMNVFCMNCTQLLLRRDVLLFVLRGGAGRAVDGESGGLLCCFPGQRTGAAGSGDDMDDSVWQCCFYFYVMIRSMSLCYIIYSFLCLSILFCPCMCQIPMYIHMYTGCLSIQAAAGQGSFTALLQSFPLHCGHWFDGLRQGIFANLTSIMISVMYISFIVQCLFVLCSDTHSFWFLLFYFISHDIHSLLTFSKIVLLIIILTLI